MALPFRQKAMVKTVFLAQRAKKVAVKGRIPLQELEEGPRSGPHLLVLVILETEYCFSSFYRSH